MDDFENANNLTLTEIAFFPTVDFCRKIWGTESESGTIALLGSTPEFYTTTEFYTSPQPYTSPGFFVLSTNSQIVEISGASATAPALIEKSSSLPGLIQSIEGKIKTKASPKGISFVNNDSSIALYGSKERIAPSLDSLEKLTRKVFNTSNEWYIGLASFPELVVSSTPDSLQSISKDIFFVVESTSSDIFDNSVLVGTDSGSIACYGQFAHTNIAIIYNESNAHYQANFSNASLIGSQSDILGDVLFLFTVDGEDSIVSHAAHLTAPMLLRGDDTKSTDKNLLEFSNFDIEVKVGWREIIII